MINVNAEYLETKCIRLNSKLYHVVQDKIIETTVTRIQSNENGIYIFAENDKGVQYRFILINYSTGKSHFGKEVFITLKDYEEWKENRTNPESLREELANYSHVAWCGWMQYMFSKCERNEDGTVVIPKSFVNRWERQMNTYYQDLPEEEKGSYRDEADSILEVINGI